LGEQINVAETEEICVSSNSLTFDDYLNCRKMNLIVNVFYNDGVFRELLEFLKWESVSIWSWLLKIYKGMKKYEKWTELLQEFLAETEQELWGERKVLVESTQSRDSISQYIDGRLGGNLMFKYKGLSMTHCLEDVAKVAQSAANDVLRDSSKLTSKKEKFIDEVVKYNLCRMSDIFVEKPKSRSLEFSYDILKYSNDDVPVSITDYEFSEPKNIDFEFDDSQLEELQNYLKLFGVTEHGISRILSRVYIRKLFRNARGGEIDRDQESLIMTKGQAALSGLNEFD